MRIANTPEDTFAAVEAALEQSAQERSAWLARVDDFLKENSWDRTWSEMDKLIQDAAMRAAAEAEIELAQSGAAQPATARARAAQADMERL